MSESGGEFHLIEKYFAPLAKGADGAFALRDDAALIPPGSFVITKDMLIEGVHFRTEDPYDLIARKLLRVNVSDLAAKGAKPVGYLLSCAWRSGVSEQQVAAFAEGLKSDQGAFGLALYGGDTTVHRDASAPLTLSATLFGRPPPTGPFRRAGARDGDDLWVTGVIGDGYLGLQAASGAFKLPTDERLSLTRAYQVPDPPADFGEIAGGLAIGGAMDVSDGLLADTEKLVHASSVERNGVFGADIDAAAIPLSPIAAKLLEGAPDADAFFADIATGGDDYQVLFTAPESERENVRQAFSQSARNATRIGAIGSSPGVRLIGVNGAPLKISRGGFDHFK